MSLSGKLVILKSVLNSIHVYFMAVFQAPIGVLNNSEKITRSFLWCSSEGHRKISWIAWESICKSQDLGGLVLGFLNWRNKVLLLKWLWRLRAEPGALWRRIIFNKYGLGEDHLFSFLNLLEVGNLSTILQDIVNSAKEVNVLSNTFKDGLSCLVGDGRSIRFWEAPWADCKPL